MTTVLSAINTTLDPIREIRVTRMHQLVWGGYTPAGVRRSIDLVPKPKRCVAILASYANVDHIFRFGLCSSRSADLYSWCRMHLRPRADLLLQVLYSECEPILRTSHSRPFHAPEFAFCTRTGMRAQPADMSSMRDLMFLGRRPPIRHRLHARTSALPLH